MRLRRLLHVIAVTILTFTMAGCTPAIDGRAGIMSLPGGRVVAVVGSCQGSFNMLALEDIAARRELRVHLPESSAWAQLDITEQVARLKERSTAKPPVIALIGYSTEGETASRAVRFTEADVSRIGSGDVLWTRANGTAEGQTSITPLSEFRAAMCQE